MDLDKELRPTREVVEAAETAFNDYLDYVTFEKKMPLEGGTENQYWDWIESIECIKAAHEKAQKECQAEYEDMMERMQKQKRK